jgi:hypothetical protein
MQNSAPFICDTCKSECNSLKSLQHHKANKKGCRTIVEETPSRDALFCAHCGAKCNSDKDMKYHLADKKSCRIKNVLKDIERLEQKRKNIDAKKRRIDSLLMEVTRLRQEVSEEEKDCEELERITCNV